ncbi:mitochondrial pyruvate carrier 1 isoform X1 [Triticum aestivum]|uniref:mitochondrial pyruvate carrier 1 isoform X1 n=1 Tax=Triticum aestivum TaxID=4565 RepID=UPI001D02E3D4|nr:mitochondrial pyruvate carrier 1-like isoform X1 [Triticum aestivum]
MATAFKAFLNSPVGPKTTHFWGPVSNWGFILAGMADMNKPPELISGHMTAVMCVYSGLFMRFAWVVRPRNYFLMATHASNESVQLYQLSRYARAQGETKRCVVIVGIRPLLSSQVADRTTDSSGSPTATCSTCVVIPRV